LAIVERQLAIDHTAFKIDLWNDRNHTGERWAGSNTLCLRLALKCVCIAQL